MRTISPPPKSDDKGNPARYTQEELKELKGPDSKVPGYTANFSDLRKNQMVQVYFVRKKGMPMKPAAPAVKAPGDPAKAKDADLANALAADPNEFSPKASIVVIIGDAPPQ